MQIKNLARKEMAVRKMKIQRQRRINERHSNSLQTEEIKKLLDTYTHNPPLFRVKEWEYGKQVELMER